MTNKEAIEALTSKDVHNSDMMLEALDMAIKALEQEPKTGIWKEDIDNNRRWDRVRFYCSECGDWQTYGKPKFCPNCGCRMESEG